MSGFKLYFVTLLFILLPSLILGQSIQGLFTSEKGDTIKFINDSIYLKLLNAEENVLLGTGYFKQKRSKLIVNTTFFPYKKSHYNVIYKENGDHAIEFYIKNISSEPIPNVMISQILNNSELGEATKTDNEGRAIMNINSMHDVKSFVTNKIGYNSLEVPISRGYSEQYNITLESADVLYFENEKLIFHYKIDGNIIKLILYRIKERGRIKKGSLIVLIKSV